MTDNQTATLTSTRELFNGFYAIIVNGCMEEEETRGMLTFFETFEYLVSKNVTVNGDTISPIDLVEEFTETDVIEIPALVSEDMFNVHWSETDGLQWSPKVIEPAFKIIRLF